jgi:ABC-2 type transport system ATP-binding protein
MAAATPAIEARRLTKSYGRHRGIVEVDLRVEQGEIFGFLGPNGAGKTTAIRTILDLQRPSSGEARVLGLDSHRDAVAIKRHVGYLAGDLALYERLTGRRHLEWLAELRGGVDRSTINELAERFGADLDRPIRDLSKGNRQKIGLVQVLMHRPDVLLLDEPTSGLDPLMQNEFLAVVRETADDGRTVFLSSHDLDEVQRVAHRVGIIRDGQVAAVETVDTLRHRAVRHVEITFAGTVDGDLGFASLPGVSDVTWIEPSSGGEGRIVRLSVVGELDAVVKHAASHHVVDLISEAADLDEIFLSYYRGDDAGDGR